MKKKNPLYVIKGKDVQEAGSIFDLVVKRFNLEPMVQLIQNIFKMLLEQVQNYSMFKAVKDFIDQMMMGYNAFLKRIGLA